MNTQLSQADKQHFLERGHVVLHDCFDPAIAQRWSDEAFARLGYDRHDAATWREKRLHLPLTQQVEVREFAPKVWQAACELLGGEERIAQPYKWSDGFIMNLGVGRDEPWRPPSPQVKGWHKDGDFFRHFLDSPEQGLLTIVLWSDIEPQGGGTFVACDSVPVVARYLAARPEGVMPNQFPFRDMIQECRDFIELTGKVGDVVLLHPYVLHSKSQNHLGTARLITNPPLHLREPMNFNRAPAELSLVEQSVLRGLGVERLDFQPTMPREKVVPPRIQKQQELAKAMAQNAA